MDRPLIVLTLACVLALAGCSGAPVADAPNDPAPGGGSGEVHGTMTAVGDSNASANNATGPTPDAP